MNIPQNDYKEFRAKSTSPIILLPIEFRPGVQVYAIIPLRQGFFSYLRLCESSRIDGILRVNVFLKYTERELN
jgi:hypothetical protein